MKQAKMNETILTDARGCDGRGTHINVLGSRYPLPACAAMTVEGYITTL